MDKYEKLHRAYLQRYAQQIAAIYREATIGASLLASSLKADTSKPFSFADHPAAQKRFDALMDDMRADMYGAVEKGIVRQWDLANERNDALCRQVFGSRNLDDRAMARFYDRNLSAQEAFLARKVNGLGLSERVWNLSGQFRSELEMPWTSG